MTRLLSPHGRRLSLLCGLAAALTAGGGAASAATVTEFRLGAGSSPIRLAAGPDGNLWFTTFQGGKVGRITPAGSVIEYSAGKGVEPWGIAAGSDGNMWFVDAKANRIRRITLAGAVTEFSAGIARDGSLYGIAAGPDGNLWFTYAFGERIGRVTTAGAYSSFTDGISTSPLDRIVPGPDGAMWFNAYQAIGRITPAGAVTELSIDGNAEALAWGADGNLWFTRLDERSIGRMTPDGRVTEFSRGITPGSNPLGIAAGPDGNVWFAMNEGRIGRITPAGRITEFSLGIAAGADLVDIVAGPDDAMWFTESRGIGRITTAPAPAPAIVTRRAPVGGGGATSVELTCPAGTQPCAGQVVLSTTIRVRERVPGSKTRTRTVARSVTAGRSARFAIAAGQRSAVKVTLSRTARSRLVRSKAGRLAALIRAMSTGGDVRRRLTLTRAP